MHTAYVVILFSSLMAQAPDVPPFVKEQAKAVTFYYQSPHPDLGPKTP
jgi:hypothetical protein